MRIDNLTWPEVEQLFNKKIVILPIGATEQHGPHLPMGTDTFYAEHIATEIGKNLEIGVLPPISFSVSGYNFPYPTITIEPETFSLLLKDICKSLVFFGVEKLILIAGHGGENCSSVETAAYCVARDLGIKIKVIYPWTFLPEEMRKKMENDWHSGYLETSDMLFLKSELVKKDKIKESSIPKPMDFLIDYKTVKRDNRQGVFGNPVGADAKIGKENLDFVIQKLTQLISSLM